MAFWSKRQSASGAPAATQSSLATLISLQRNDGQTQFPNIALISLETPPAGRAIEIGEMVAVATVQASNIVKDVRELITNALGGRMHRYERLLELTLASGLERFREELAAQGYDGALGVRLAHPTLVQGGAEIIVYGTGFRYTEKKVDAAAE